MNTALYFDSPIRQGGKKILKRDNINFNAKSEQIEEEDQQFEGMLSEINEPIQSNKKGKYSMYQ